MIVMGVGDGHAREHLDEFGEVSGVDIRVRRLVDGDLGEPFAKLGIIESRVVVADWTGGKVGEEVENAAAASRVEDPRAFRLAQIHDDFISVCEHMSRQDAVHVAGLDDETAISDGSDGHGDSCEVCS